MNFQFKVVSIFSGCGGSSLGYQMAGGKILLAVEWDDHAVQTYNLNFPDTPIFHGDIAKLSVEEILTRTGLKPGDLDIFDGSPPCQGFSTAGKRCFTDERNQLFKEYVRLLRGLQPKVFVMENVSGMVKGKMKLIFVEILKELKASGYDVKARLMNAMYYGVPQSRKRMIFIGVRNDLGIVPSHPNPQQKIITVKESFKNITPKNIGTPLSKWELERWYKLKPGRSFGDIDGSGYSMVKINPDKPCNSIPKSIAFGGHSYLYHFLEPRGISIEEVKRIHTYPDSYQFIGKFEDQWARIGNSVPPLLMKAIAEHIKTNILDKINREVTP